MTLQFIAVAVLVAGCSAYAAWTLMPTALRRWLATRLLAMPLPEALAASMRRHASASAGCACDGCDRGIAKKAPAAVQPIRFQPRPRR